MRTVRRWSILRSLQGRNDRLRNAELGVVMRPPMEIEWEVDPIPFPGLNLGSGWANYGGGFFNASYGRHPETGAIVVRGLVRCSAGAVPTICDLPYGPPASSVVYQVGQGGPGNTVERRWLNILPSGAIQVELFGGATVPYAFTWLSLDGITFLP